MNSEGDVPTTALRDPDDRSPEIETGLDPSPGRPVNTAQPAARTDVVRLARPALTRRSRDGIALAGLLVAVIVLVVFIAISGTTTGGAAAGVQGAIGPAGGSDAVATAAALTADPKGGEVGRASAVLYQP